MSKENITEEKINDILSEMVNVKNTRLVSLDDKINVGCNFCGGCCMNTQVRLSSFDIYNLAKKDTHENIMKHLALYFGENSDGALVSLEPGKDGTCAYLKINSDGDFKCSLEDNKPITCNAPFLAGVKQAENLSFVPLDKEVEKLDLEETLEDIKQNQKYAFIEDRNNNCKAPKEEITVREYLGNRYKYSRENDIANLIAMLQLRYINTAKLVKLITLCEKSSANMLKDILYKDGDKTEPSNKILNAIFLQTYFYVEDDEDFMEKSIKQFHYLQDKMLPSLRILYKFLLKVLDPDGDTINKILDIENSRQCQEEFNMFYFKNMIEISNRFISIAKEMMKEMEGISIDSE